MGAQLFTSLSCARRHVPWPASGQAWLEGAVLLALAAGAGVLTWLGSGLALVWQLALWGLLLGGIAVVLRRGWLVLFGPVLSFDLVREARKGRYARARTLYAILQMWLLIVVWCTAAYDRLPGPVQFLSSRSMPPRLIADVNFYFFISFMTLQMLMVLVITPAFTAGAIAEEKERRTLEMLLGTDIRSHEIVLSVLVSRLGNMALVILTGLPILAILQIMGGIDPELLLASFALTGITLVSLGSLSLLCSVYARRPWHAVLQAMVLTVSYLAFSGLAHALVKRPAASATLLDDVVIVVNQGNFVTLGVQVVRDIKLGRPLGTFMPEHLAWYAVWHGLLAVFCIGMAVVRLRPVALHQASGPSVRKHIVGAVRLKPRLWRWPMLWKEVFCEPKPRRGLLARVSFAGLVLASFAPLYYIFDKFLIEVPFVKWDMVTEAVNNWVPWVGTPVALFLLLQVMMRAAESFTTEQRQQTFDGLVMTLLNRDGMVVAKWLGSILAPRQTWLWLGAIWLTAYLLGGLTLSALASLLAATVMMAMFLASVGVLCSVVTRPGQSVLLYTFFAATLIMTSHWMFWLLEKVLLRHLPFWNPRWFLFLEAIGLMPPLTLIYLTENRGFMVFLTIMYDMDVSCAPTAMPVAAVLWICSSLIILALACRRFRKTIGRGCDFTPQPVPASPEGSRP